MGRGERSVREGGSPQVAEAGATKKAEYARTYVDRALRNGISKRTARSRGAGHASRAAVIGGPGPPRGVDRAGRKSGPYPPVGVVGADPHR